MISPYLTLAIMAGYFCLLLLIGWLTGKQHSNDAFFLANRHSPWWVVSIGMIGGSISGVSFVSVPGMVRESGFLYMQTVAGFFFGYLLIAEILLPLYYKLASASIYGYLDKRYGKYAYKTGAGFFFLANTFATAPEPILSF
jgi:Na+/proline symporter